MSNLSTEAEFLSLDPKKNILIKGAKVNNLKNVDVAIPRNKLVVITGVSGSGKSSLAYDTLFAEGQRMYVESLSSYARQFLGRMEKPEVDYIKGVSPAIAIEQKVASRNPRSTVGTTTEIYDYLKLLFARIGKTISPVSGKEVTKDTVSSIIDKLYNYEEGDRVQIFAPLLRNEDRKLSVELDILVQKGFTRIEVDQELKFIEEIDEKEIKSFEKKPINILIDRNVIRKDDEEGKYRMSDSIQTALFEGRGTCIAEVIGKERKAYSDKFELDGITFEEPSANLFTFNNPYGACKTCEGFGHVLGLDPDLIIPDKSMSVYEGAIAPWRGEKTSEWLEPLIKNGIRFNFPIHRAYSDLTDEEKEVLWNGNEFFQGINDFFKFVETQLHKIQYRVMLSRFRGRTVCPDCHGTRLRKDAGYVKIGGKSIIDLVLMPINDLHPFFEELELSKHDQQVASRLLIEIRNRLGFLRQVGLGYLTLNRLANSLSGGESQRIKLATSLGSALVGSMYILDEPSIGLHPRDSKQLIEVLQHLRDLGNTVIVVEHEEEIINASDELIDIGPGAGNWGGEVVYAGEPKNLVKGKGEKERSLTFQYLTGKKEIEVPSVRRKLRDFIQVNKATENNLQNLDVQFPLGVLSVITGVSGSGKSTLVKKLLHPALVRHFGGYDAQIGKMEGLTGSLSMVKGVEFVDQNPIGKSSRSNPVTYIKAFDIIRELYASQPLAKQRGYKPGYFSFNVEGGRCEECQGEGVVKIEM